MVRSALEGSDWLAGEGVKIASQGSFTNRTNTRLESDIDLRVQHPALRIEYAHGVDPGLATVVGTYVNTGNRAVDLLGAMRYEIVRVLTAKFGADSIDFQGKRAIRVRGLEGSRSSVDAVPCFTLHRIRGSSFAGNDIDEGIAILSKDGFWTYNYPEQHLANGRAKRLRTGLQFKRIVRILKRLQSEMSERGIVGTTLPSFLIECIVYSVNDTQFTQPDDDRYARVRRVLKSALGAHDNWFSSLLQTEINGIKPLYLNQSWTQPQVETFLRAGLNYLGDQ